MNDEQKKGDSVANSTDSQRVSILVLSGWVGEAIWVVGYVVFPLVALLVAIVTGDFGTVSEWWPGIPGIALLVAACLFFIWVMADARRWDDSRERRLNPLEESKTPQVTNTE